MNNKKLKIAVIGGGNIGTYLACICAIHNYTVNIYSTKPHLYNNELEIIDENDNVKKAQIELISSNIKEVLNNCNIILITYPAFLLEQVEQLISPYINSDVSIGIFPGTGGVEFIFKKEIEKGISIFGLQRVPCVARLVTYGKRVRCEGFRSELFLASIPAKKGEQFAKFITDITDIQCSVLSNYLNITLTPSNPILHTSRLRVLFKDYKPNKIYYSQKLFYHDWDNESSELLLACDEEVQKICSALSHYDLSSVKSLREHYESNTVEELTKKLHNIKSLKNIKTPMVPFKDGWIPDFSSRYFTADFPYGIFILKEIADIQGVPVPNLTEIVTWYKKIFPNVQSFNLSKYGIKNKNDFNEYYSKFN